VLILDGHTIHVTPRAITHTGSQGLSLIRRVPHSSHITQPLDLYVFGLFQTVYYKERKFKAMKGETRKMYRTLLAFYKTAIIPMVGGLSKELDFCLISRTSEIQSIFFQQSSGSNCCSLL
jgi:hypothetical protein